VVKYSIVIPTIGQIQKLRRCIDKTLEHTNADMIGEIIIVADKTNNDVLANLMMLYLGNGTPYTIVLNHKIVGRPKAVEDGLMVATNDAAIILENGVEPFIGWLDELKAEFTPERGWVAANSLEDNNGKLFMGCSMIDIPLFKTLGGFDPSFSPFGFEDLDLLNRMINMGKQPCIAKRAGVHHPQPHTTVAPIHCSGTTYQEHMKKQEAKYINKYNGQGINWSDIEEIA